MHRPGDGRRKLRRLHRYERLVLLQDEHPGLRRGLVPRDEAYSR